MFIGLQVLFLNNLKNFFAAKKRIKWQVLDDMIQIFDTHTHYDDKSFDEDRELLLQDITNADVQCVVNVAANMRGCEDTLKLIKVS